MHNDVVGSRCNEKSQQGRIHEKVRMDVEEDRLSSLPDDVIHMILSLISLREAIGTCVLSSRWRFIWTSLPCLGFTSQDLFPEFVSNVVHQRNNELQLSSLELVPSGDDIDVAHECVKRILDYASSHDVQQLTITTNTHVMSNYVVAALEAKPTWGLTRLHLDGFILPDVDDLTGVFSKCPNLKDLSLRRCTVWVGRRDAVVNICHPQLSNLTLEGAYPRLASLKVVAPQLKNLTIINCGVKQYLISAPGLTSLVIKGGRPLQLNATQGGFPSLEKVDLHFYQLRSEDSPCELVCLLHQLHNVKFLTLNLEILEVLSSSMEPPISHQPSSPFANLNILRFLTSYPATIYMEVQPVTEMKNNMLQDSFPSAIVTMISSEEIRGMRSIVSARKLIEEVRKLLDKCTTYALWGKQRGRSCCWYFTRDMNVSESEELVATKLQGIRGLIEESVVTKLQGIKGLLTGLPVSKRPAIQAIYSSVCEEAHVVTKNFLEYTNIEYNNNRQRSRFNGQFRETFDAGSIQSILAWFEETSLF